MNDQIISRPAIEINGVTKTFVLPTERRDTLKENFIHAFRGGLRRAGGGGRRGIFSKLDYQNFEALNNVTFAVHPGEFVGIMGKNGSGKSTLLRIIAGIYRPTEGRVTINGRVAPFLELGIGFQPELTARENIRINGTLLGMTGAQIRSRFDAIVDFAEIREFLDLKVKNYSSGMRSRLAFAIAKEADADIYLCDEVLAVGDAAFQQKCIQVFRDWHAKGKTILFVSHSSELVEQLCQRVILLEEGRVVMEGNPAPVISAYSHKA